MNREQWNEYVAIASRPAFRFTWQNESADSLRKAFVEETRVVGGALRWKANGSVIAPDVFSDAGLITPQVQAEKYAAYVDAVVGEYRANPPQLSDENRAEALNELGPGAVDVITGQKI